MMRPIGPVLRSAHDQNVPARRAQWYNTGVSRAAWRAFEAAQKRPQGRRERESARRYNPSFCLHQLASIKCERIVTLPQSSLNLYVSESD